jgi:hypothetical protein
MRVIIELEGFKRGEVGETYQKPMSESAPPDLMRAFKPVAKPSGGLLAEKHPIGRCHQKSSAAQRENIRIFSPNQTTRSTYDWESSHDKAFIMNDFTCACEGYDPLVIPISVTQIGLLNCDRTDCTYFLNPARSFHDPYLLQHQHLIPKKAQDHSPMNTNKVHPPTPILNPIQKRLHPIQLPHDRRTAQRHALIPPRLDLLHV